jgi:hypothetical protein
MLSRSAERLPHAKQFYYRGPVCWSQSYMVKSDDPRGIDQHITTLLLGISPRPLGQLSAKQLQKVGPPHSWAQEIPWLGLPHTVRVIELTLLVHEKGAAEARLFDIGACNMTSLEGNADDPNAKLAEALFRVLHLHEVPSTGQSAEMAVENHQQPGAAVLLEAADLALGIGQTKGHCGLANETIHEAYHRSSVIRFRPGVVTAF